MSSDLSLARAVEPPPAAAAGPGERASPPTTMDLGDWGETPAVIWLDRFQKAQKEQNSVEDEPEDFQTPEEYDALSHSISKKPRRQDEAYEDLLGRLEADDYETCLTFLARANNHLATLLRRFWLTKYNYKAGSGDARKRRIATQSLVIELIIGLIVRWINEKVWVFPNAALSLHAVDCRCPTRLFDLLSGLRIFYSRKIAHEIARDLGRRRMDPTRRPKDASVVVGMAVYDNLLLRLKTNREHGDVMRQNDLYQTIQWTTVDLSNQFDAAILKALLEHDGHWHDGGGNARAVRILTDFSTHEDYRDAIWKSFVSLSSQGDNRGGSACFALLAHPKYDPQGPSRLVFQRHVGTTYGTALYEDNQRVLNHIQQYMCATLGMKLIIVVGDQQSFSRMVGLKRQFPLDNMKIVPFPGEFHFAVHLLMAVHILCREALVDRLIELTGICRRTCSESKWDSVEKYNHYCFLYEALIVGIFTYLRSFLSPAQLANYPLLLFQARDSPGAVVLLKFLLDAASKTTTTLYFLDFH
mmetsp:Transcript_2311/g.6905  ORF Transcript_2311/g.6905 Transcript_2311/m.6905 type:complete len:527 (+) Transcript_2311:59-1639(+)